MTNTLYSSQLRAKGSQKGKADKSDEHNLRLEKDNPNFDKDLTKNNIYLYETPDGKIVNIPPTNKNLQTLNNKVQQAISQNRQRFFNACDEDGEQLSQSQRDKKIKQRFDLKRKFKKWLDNDKTTEPEKEIFQKCHDILENKKQSNASLITDFKNIESKISRRNDKLKAIEKVADFDMLANTKNRNINRKIETAEILFKIPDKNKISVKAEHWQKLAEHFKNKHFPNNQMLYAAIHADENPENTHLHLKLSGFNKKNKSYDFADQEVDILKKHFENTKTPYPVKNKLWQEYNEEDLKNHGEFFQNFVFSQMNKYLQKMGYQVDFQKRTEKQKLDDNHTYEKTKKSTNRQHNRQNKVEEDIKQKKSEGKKAIQNNNEHIESQNMEIEFNNDMLTLQQDEIKNNKQTIDEQKSTIKELATLITELPSKVLGAVTAIKRYFQNSDISNQYDKDDKLEVLSDHLDRIEDIDNSFNAENEVNKVVRSTENNTYQQEQIFNEMNKVEQTKQQTFTRTSNSKPTRKRTYGM